MTLPNGAELAHKLLFLPFPELIPPALAFPLFPPKPPTPLSSPKIITHLIDKTNQDTLILSSNTGTEDFISQHHSILKDCENEVATDAILCNKDTGEYQKTLRKWSRGLLHFVRGGGHIERWCPLYV